MNPLMLKLLGGGLLVISGTLLGSSGAAELREEVRVLRSLSAALGIFANELTALCAPLPDIFAKLRNERFFALLDAGFGTEPTEQLWHRAAEAMEMQPECTRALANLGAVIGRYDAQRQAAEIAAVRDVLNTRADSTQRELTERGRRLPGLGAALGAMAAVLLF